MEKCVNRQRLRDGQIARQAFDDGRQNQSADEKYWRQGTRPIPSKRFSKSFLGAGTHQKENK